MTPAPAPRPTRPPPASASRAEGCCFTWLRAGWLVTLRRHQSTRVHRVVCPRGVEGAAAGSPRLPPAADPCRVTAAEGRSLKHV